MRARFGKGGRIDEQSADEGNYFSNNDDVLGTTDGRAQAVQSPFIRLRRATACCVSIAFRRIHRSSVYVTNLSATQISNSCRGPIRRFPSTPHSIVLVNNFKPVLHITETIDGSE